MMQLPAIRKCTVAIVFTVFVLTSHSRLSARTIEDVVRAACADDYAASSRFEKSATEAAAVGDKSDTNYRAAARALFRCNQQATDPYAKDWALVLYADDMILSINTNGDCETLAPIVQAKMNNLAAGTRYSDVRNSALKVRDAAKKLYELGQEAINGTSNPDASASP